MECTRKLTFFAGFDIDRLSRPTSGTSSLAALDDVPSSALLQTSKGSVAGPGLEALERFAAVGGLAAPAILLSCLTQYICTVYLDQSTLDHAEVPFAHAEASTRSCTPGCPQCSQQ